MYFVALNFRNNEGHNEYLFTPNNICFEIIMSRNSYLNKQKPIRIGYIGFYLIGGSRYNFMVAKS